MTRITESAFAEAKDFNICREHSNGKPAVILSFSESQYGEIFLVDADMRAAVKISSNGQKDGGFLTVNHPNGKAAVILSSTDITGAVILNAPRGKQFATLPDTKGPDGGKK